MAERKPPKLLLVEDDLGLQRQLAWTFDDFEVFRAGDRTAAVDVLERERPSVVLLDLGLPPDADGPSEGLATLQAVLRASPESKVIMMSGQTERSEEHTSELQSLMRNSYAVFCLKKKNKEII